MFGARGGFERWESLCRTVLPLKGLLSLPQGSLLSLAPGEPLWEHTGLDIHLPVIPALRPSCLVCRALLKMGALNKLGLI